MESVQLLCELHRKPTTNSSLNSITRSSSASLASLPSPRPATSWPQLSSRPPSRLEQAASTDHKTPSATTPLATTKTTRAAAHSDVRQETWPVRPEATVSATLTEEHVLLTTSPMLLVSAPQSRPTSLV